MDVFLYCFCICFTSSIKWLCLLCWLFLLYGQLLASFLSAPLASCLSLVSMIDCISCSTCCLSLSVLSPLSSQVTGRCRLSRQRFVPAASCSVPRDIPRAAVSNCLKYCSICFGRFRPVGQSLIASQWFYIYMYPNNMLAS